VNAGGSLTAGTMIVSQNQWAGVLKVQGGTLATGALDIRDNGTVTVSSGSLTSSSITVAAQTVVTNGILNISGGTVTANGAVNSSGTVNINGGTLATGGNTIQVAAGNFNVSGGAVTSTTAINLSGGDMNLSAGSVTLTDPSPGGGTFIVMATGGTGKLNVTGGKFDVAGASGATDTMQIAGTINLSGGQLLLTNGQVIAANTPTVNIHGTNTVIRIDRLNLNQASRAVTFNFNFNSNGVSTIRESTSSYVDLSYATLNIDGSLYTGGPATFDLFKHANVVATSSVVNVTGFGTSGVHYRIEQTNGVGGYVRLAVLNHAPVVTNLTMSVPQGGSNTLSIIGGKHSPTDQEGDSMTITAVSLNTPANAGTASIVGGTSVSYTASAAFSGTDTFNYTISDGHGGLATATVTVAVFAANTGPNITGISGTSPTITVKAQGVPNATYQLQYTTNTTTVNWQDVSGAGGGATASASSGAMTFTDVNATNSQAWYRTRYVSGP